jgi:aspartate ammonia-lyase
MTAQIWHFEKGTQTSMSNGGATRTETDSLGSKEIPADARWGTNVSRALDNDALNSAA